jgi:hypothetical protein
MLDNHGSIGYGVAMMKFESDLDAPVRVIPTGTPDLLDEWYDDEPTDQDWGDWFELTFDPDA